MDPAPWRPLMTSVNFKAKIGAGVCPGVRGGMAPRPAAHVGAAHWTQNKHQQREVTDT